MTALAVAIAVAVALLSWRLLLLARLVREHGRMIALAAEAIAGLAATSAAHNALIRRQADPDHRSEPTLH